MADASPTPGSSLTTDQGQNVATTPRTDTTSPDPDGASDPDASIWAIPHRALTIGLVLTITLVAFESLAVATVMPEVERDLGGLGLYGWVFSGFFLASLVGIVLTGQLADRRGLGMPFGFGLAFFAGGLMVGGAAQSMPMLIAGRVAQGFGAGAIPAVAYASIGRGMPPSLRPTMFATLSTAWVVPGLVGPAIATVVEHTWTWRLIFLGLLPIIAIAASMALPALIALDQNHPMRKEPVDWVHLGRVVVLVGGVGAVFAAADVPLPVAVVLAMVGLPAAAWAFDVLQPAGTARLAPGLPATVAVRGLLTWAFFAGDAYVSLAITEGRGAPTWVAGAALSAGAVSWTIGSWTQARLIDRVGPRRLVGAGMAVLAVGITGLGISMAGLPLAVSIAAWGLAASGVGLAYPTLSVTALATAIPGAEGAASASLQLSDTLGTAVGTGLGGAIIAIFHARDLSITASTSTVFTMAFAVAIMGVLASRRLPERVAQP